MSTIEKRSGDQCLLTSLQRYIKSILDQVTGLKVLILDAETTGIVSLIYGQSEIVKKEVYLVEKVESGSQSNSVRQPMRHLNAIYFVRPTPENFLSIVKELKSPRFGQYHLFFSSIVPKQQLERIAKSDEHEVVHQVRECFADIYVINPNLFSLELPSIGLLPLQDAYHWTPYDEAIFKRICDGLFSGLLCSLKSHFLGIRFPRESDICRKIANQMQIRLAEESELLHDTFCDSSASNLFGTSSPTPSTTGCVLLLFDRREDPVTPLLNQWTFQAMTHELIGIRRNRVHLETYREPEVDDSSDVVLSYSTDPFFATHWNSNFGDLGTAIQNYVKTYQQQTQSTAQLESIEDMRRFVDRYPEFRKLSGNVSKHVAIVHELSKLVEFNKLLDVSVLEQQLACSDNKTEHLKSVLDRLRSQDIPKFEKLRLVLLYSLRYENDPYIRNLKDELRKSGIEEPQVEIVDALLNHAGSQRRSSELFQRRDFLQLAKTVVQRGFKGVPNIYTQHSPYLRSTVESLIKGRLREQQYSFLPNTTVSYKPAQQHQQPKPSLINSVTDRPSEILVFVVGGTTYEEAVNLYSLEVQHNCRIILGGTAIHNSKTFLADIAQLSKVKQQHSFSKPSWESWEADPMTSGHRISHKQAQSDGYSIPIDLSSNSGQQELVPIEAFSRSLATVPIVNDREKDLASKREFLRQKW